LSRAHSPILDQYRHPRRQSARQRRAAVGQLAAEQGRADRAIRDERGPALASRPADRGLHALCARDCQPRRRRRARCGHCRGDRRLECPVGRDGALGSSSSKTRKSRCLSSAGGEESPCAAGPADGPRLTPPPQMALPARPRFFELWPSQYASRAFSALSTAHPRSPGRLRAARAPMSLSTALRQAFRPSGYWLPVSIALCLWIAVGGFYIFQERALDRDARDTAATRSSEIAASYAADVGTSLYLVDNVLRLVSAQFGQNGMAAALALVSEQHLG